MYAKMNEILFVKLTAMAAGLPFLSPYLNKEADFEHGVNFAVASSTAMSIEDLAARNITVSPETVNSSLNVQVDWMANYLRTFCKPGQGSFSFAFFFRYSLAGC